MTFSPGVRVHVVGIGGAGMSSLAVLLQEYGCDVSGCDVANAVMMGELRDRGIDVSTGHDARHVATADVVLWSPAVATDHEELVAARAHQLVVMPRSRVLGELSTLTRIIGLTGTHGKTTATSMLVHIMRASGRDDARLLGAPVRGVGFGGHFASGDLIAEVDESYGAFSELHPFALGLLNVEADHLDHYVSLENLESAFTDVLRRTSGPLVVWTDDPGASRVASALTRDWVSVGTSGDVTWRLCDVEVSGRRSRARLAGPIDVAIDLRVTGRHNLANAAVAAALAMSVGVESAHVTDGLRSFRGVPRRFEHVATWNGIDVVDDYAHLPGEIVATVEAAHGAGYHKIVTVFQPHRVTRTLSVAGGFAPAFDRVDDVIVTDIYTAGEPNPDAVTGEFVARFVRDRGTTRAHYAPALSDAAHWLDTKGADADLVLLLGAGDVNKVLDFLPHSGALVHGNDDIDDRFLLGVGPQVEYGAPLGARTTYRVGGSVRALVTLSHEADLDEFSERLAANASRIVVVGNGSNLLVADGRHDLIAVHLDGDFATMSISDDVDAVVVVAGAGLDLPVAARRLAAEGVVGFEWAVGVPGTFGGAVAMNAGGHGSDMRASVRRVEVWSGGRRRWRDAQEMSFAYRSSSLRRGEIVTRVELRLQRGDPARSKEMISQIVRWRREHQPGGANAGSVFRNPDGDSAGRLIEAAGLKGFRLGSVAISPKHANFIIADAGATAADVMTLMRHVRRHVGERSGVWLETEHRLVGFEQTW